MKIRVVKEAKENLVFTHAGNFHADEVVACAILAGVFNTVNVKRTFNLKEVEGYTENKVFPLVVDMGRGTFDHHQGGKMRENGKPYASAGLVWNEFGMKYLENVLGGYTIFPNVNLLELKSKVEEKVILPVDLADNGDGTELHYITELVSNFNSIELTADTQFELVANIVADVLENIVYQIAEKMALETELDKYIEQSLKGAGDSRVVLFMDRFVPAVQMLTQKGMYERFDFLAYPDQRGDYAVSALAATPGAFDNKYLFPVEWRGKTGSELAELSSIEDAVFCHAGGFFFTAKTKESAMKAVEQAVVNVK